MGQNWDADAYAKNARFVSDLGFPVFELLAPRAEERILDLGCGDGALTVRLVEAGADIVGVDSSPSQIEAARARNLNAHVADGHALTFESEFDAVFSNAALHWMTQPNLVIAGVWRALKPGGRFVAEMGGQGNLATIHSALQAVLQRRGIDGSKAMPKYYPALDEHKERLEKAGFEISSIQILPRPTVLPTGIRGWIEALGRGYLALLPKQVWPDYIAEVERVLTPALRQPDGTWIADYARLRFKAIKPAMSLP